MMSRFEQLTRVAVAASLLTLGAAGTADAATRQVAKTGVNMGDCIGTPCLTIGYAISKAAANDTIQIGPGLYAEAVQSFTAPLTLVGAGAGTEAAADPSTDTIIAPNSNFLNTDALTLSEDTTVRGIRLRGADAAGGNAAGKALNLLPDPAGARSYTIEDVVAIGGIDLMNADPAAVLVSDTTQPGKSITATLRNTKMAAAGCFDTSCTGDTGFATLDVSGPNVTVNLEDSLVNAGVIDNGIVVSDATLNLLRSTVRATEYGGMFPDATRTGIRLTGSTSDTGATATIDRSRVFGGTSSALSLARQSVATARNSLIATTLTNDLTSVNSTQAISVGSQVSTQQPRLIAIGSTIVARAKGIDTALRLSNAVAGRPSATLRNTVVHAEDLGGAAVPDVSIESYGAGSPIVFDASASRFATVATSGPQPGEVTATAPGSGTNITGAPLFKDAAGGDFSLLAGSPGIDAGDSAESFGTLDLAGATRVVDGDTNCTAVPDIGAFELQGNALDVCPTPPAGGGEQPGGGTPQQPGGGTTTTTTTPPVLAPGQSADGRFPAKLEVKKMGIDRARRRLVGTIELTGRATGTVAGALRAAGRTVRFSVPVPASANGSAHRLSFTVPLSRAQTELGTGIVTLSYAGNARVRPDEVRTRAANGVAALKRTAATITGGRLVVAGTVSRRARGSVRVRFGYNRPDRTFAFFSVTAPIKDGAWSIDVPLPAGGETGGELSIQFTGYLKGPIRGEQDAKTVAP